MKKFIIIMLLLIAQNSFSYWKCYAQNTYGIFFWGAGVTKYEASQKALYACQVNTDFSGRCWVTDWCDWK